MSNGHLYASGYVATSNSSGASTTAVGPTTLDDLQGVTISGVTDGDMLLYDGVDERWENTPSTTGSNIGLGGVGIFKQKTLGELEFKNINAGSSKITITDDTGNDEIDIDVDESSIAIANLSGAPSGSVVGTTDAQTLTNKTIDADSNTITNIDNGEIKAGAAIDASKLANGTVSNTEFQYINSLTSNAQTQLDSKASSSHTHDATDIADGSVSNTEFQYINSLTSNAQTQID